MTEHKPEEKRKNPREFCRKAAAVCRRFRRVWRENPTDFLRENGALLEKNLRDAVGSFRSVRTLPFSHGEPRIVSLAKSYWRGKSGVPTTERLVCFLSETNALFYDDELRLLPASLTVAAMLLWAETGEETWLARLSLLRDADFEAVFFRASAVERIFLSEDVGTYSHADDATRHLYHRRLTREAAKRGVDEIGLARRVVHDANRRKTHIGAVLPAKRGNAPRFYFYFLAVLTVAVLTAFFFVSDLGARALFLMLPLAVPAYALVKEALPGAFSSVGEKSLPRLASREETDGAKTLVSIATFLSGEAKDAAIFDKLEDFYLTNGAENVCFAVLGDPMQSERRTTDRDEAIATYAKNRVRALNSKYGAHFALFLRERRRSQSEDAYIGWERKRGGILELCRFLRGEKTSICDYIGNIAFLREVRYLVTLDGDTNLYQGAVRDLIGTMAHPENRPIIDEKRGIVTAGHAVVQPRMIPTLDSVSRSAFARVTGGAGGLDPYAVAGSDLYQQVFDEGIFCGKGILDVDAYLAVCADFFPRERILSHDLAEGNLLRAGLASDIVLSDSTPATAASYDTRAHRWMRGDLQILPYLRRTVKDADGHARQNPMTRLGKYKIADNLLREATPFFAVLTWLLSLLFGMRAALVTFFFAFGYLFFPFVHAVWAEIKGRNLAAMHRRFHSVTLPRLAEAALLALLRLAAAPFEAYWFADAAVRTAYRALFSKKNFLNWTSAADGDRSGEDSADAYVSRMAFSPLIGVSLMLLPIGAFRVLAVLWIAYPVVAWALSRPRRKRKVLSDGEEAFLRESAHAAWLYFRDYVNEETHALPPDNVQFSPVERVAMRTSPTNIGLYLLSVLAARDLDLITTEELCRRTDATLKTLSSMLRWHGHFYNWYDVRTLAVIGEPFVSTVDSGNFVTSLVALAEGLKEYASGCPALLDVIRRCDALIAETDFAALYDPARRLFRIGYSVRDSRFSDTCYDTLMSESLLTSFYAVATGAVPRTHYFALSRQVISSRGRIGIASWSGTAFEYFMPSLLLPTAENSLIDEALSFAYVRQRKAAVTKEARGRRTRLYGVSESAYFGFDSEMNYQYRAFGIDGLALDPHARDGLVIAPYASFLMLERDASALTANLGALRALGAFGKYGFYEAVDFDPARVGEGYAIIKSFMAHHLGMSIVAAVNATQDGIFRKRFLRVPRLRASAELLSEKIPVSAKSLPRGKRTVTPPEPMPTPMVTAAQEKPFLYHLIFPEVALISNHKTKLIASSSGHIEMTDGFDVLSYSTFSRFGLGGGLRVYALVDGICFPTVPLGVEPDGWTGTFSFLPRADAIEYRARHEKEKRNVTLSVRFSVFPDAEAFVLQCRVEGAFRRASFCLSFEPVLEKRSAYLSHPCFSDLFLESEYFGDEGVLALRRRPRTDVRGYRRLGLAVTPGAERNAFETMRENCLPLMATERDYAALAAAPLTESTGAVIVPIVVQKSGTLTAKRPTATFFLARCDNEDDLLYFLTKARKEGLTERHQSAMHDLIRLQSSMAGLAKNVTALERSVLRGIYFGPCRRAERCLPEERLDRGVLWKYGISGDNPIVTARFSSDNAEQKANLGELIRLFKYMCIRGVRYDFAILYAETDHYHAPIRREIERMIARAGCENFLSWTCGIFPIPAAELDAGAIRVFETLSVAYFELSVSPKETASTCPNYVALSVEAEARLKRGACVCVSPAAPSSPERAIARVRGGYFYECGFCIEKPHGNTPWSHVLASENFGTVLTENSLGFTFAGNAALEKLTPHEADAMREDDGERILLRLYEENDPTDWTDFDLCACAHEVDMAFGFAEYRGSVCEIEYTVRVELVGKFRMKRIAVSLCGAFKRKREICCLVHPCLGQRRVPFPSYRFEAEQGEIRVKRLDADRRALSLALFAKNGKPQTDETAFWCGGKLFDGTDRVAALSVEPEEHKNVVFYLAAYRGEIDHAFLRAIACSDALPPTETGEHLFEPISVRTEHVLFDEFCNKWTLYQTRTARILARSGYYQVGGAYGFRDQLQDVLAMIPVLPGVARSLLLRAAAHQYEDGSAQHWWHETGAGMKTRCSDDFLWLPFVALAYLTQTGDTALLSRTVPFLTSPPLDDAEQERYEIARRTKEKATFYEHLKRAALHGMRFGAHGLPLIGSGDWNDGMNAVGRGGKGESVWLGFFEALTFHALSPLCATIGDDECAALLESTARDLIGAIERDGFDGGWYRRGYYDDGSPFGSVARNDCQIDVLPQAFAMMCAEPFSLDSDRVRAAKDAVLRLLFDREQGILKLLAPPFSDDAQSPGYIKGYVPGIRENGGQYTHAAVWAALGLLCVGEHEMGAELLERIAPPLRCESEEMAADYRIEPYVLAGDVYTAEGHGGRGGWSWYTGSAAWFRTVVTEVLCGYTEREDGFTLHPRLSERFAAFSLRVRKRETDYSVSVRRTGTASLFVDGKPVESEPTSFFFRFDGGTHTIEMTR